MFAILLLPLVLASPALFDKVLLKDGRLIEGKLIESDDPAYVTLRLPGADIPIRNELVDRTYVEDMEAYVPKNKTEEDYLKKGWVLFEDRWMSRTRREQELANRAEADKKAIQMLRDQQRWKNAKTTSTLHFEVKSNATQQVMDDYATRLENYYKYFMSEWNITVAPKFKREKAKFFLYRNYFDFLEVTGVRYGVAGFFNWVDGELHLYHDDKKYDYTVAVLYHEGNHLLTYLIEPGFRFPSWMNEGTAEYFGTARVDEKGKFVVGEIQHERIVSLRHDEAQGRSIPLRDVMLMPQSGFGARHYAVAWSFVHFLMSTEYEKKYRIFFSKLPENRDLDVETNSYSNVKIPVKEPTLTSVLAAFEKAMGKSLAQLEVEWKEFTAQAYGEVDADAYYLAAQLALRTPEGITEEGVRAAKDYFEKAVSLGIQDADCYRDYAEFLRKGGVSESSNRVTVFKPDAVRGWEMIQKAIDLDPIEPLSYCEAAGLLLFDSPIQDIDKAEGLVQTARALGPRDWMVELLATELMSMIEPAKEKRRLREEKERELAAMDIRVWIVQPFHFADQPPPDKIEDLSTGDLRELIAAGTVSGDDWVFQSGRAMDPETGELEEGTEPWDLGWVPLKDVPVFASDLEAAAKSQG